MAIETIEVRVTCDECGDDELFEISRLDEHALDKALRDQQWEVGVYADRKHVCPECVATANEDTEEECARCGETFPADEMYTSEDDGTSVCEVCHEQEDDDGDEEDEDDDEEPSDGND